MKGKITHRWPTLPRIQHRERGIELVASPNLLLQFSRFARTAANNYFGKSAKNPPAHQPIRDSGLGGQRIAANQPFTSDRPTPDRLYPQAPRIPGRCRPVKEKLAEPRRLAYTAGWTSPLARVSSRRCGSCDRSRRRETAAQRKMRPIFMVRNGGDAAVGYCFASPVLVGGNGRRCPDTVGGRSAGAAPMASARGSPVGRIEGSRRLFPVRAQSDSRGLGAAGRAGAATDSRGHGIVANAHADARQGGRAWAGRSWRLHGGEGLFPKFSGSLRDRQSLSAQGQGGPAARRALSARTLAQGPIHRLRTGGNAQTNRARRRTLRGRWTIAVASPLRAVGSHGRGRVSLRHAGLCRQRANPVGSSRIDSPCSGRT